MDRVADILHYNALYRQERANYHRLRCSDAPGTHVHASLVSRSAARMGIYLRRMRMAAATHNTYAAIYADCFAA